MRQQPRLLNVGIGSDERPTPDEIFTPLHQEFRFTIDVAARKDWFASDDTSSAGTVVVLVADPFMVNPVLTQPAIEFTEDLTRLNFKVVTEQVELSFVDEVVSTPSLSFARVLEVDLGE